MIILYIYGDYQWLEIQNAFRMWLFIWFLLHIRSNYSMIHDRNKYITATVSYDFSYDFIYTCHDYHMIFNRKGSESPFDWL